MKLNGFNKILFVSMGIAFVATSCTTTKESTPPATETAAPAANDGSPFVGGTWKDPKNTTTLTFHILTPDEGKYGQGATIKAVFEPGYNINSHNDPTVTGGLTSEMLHVKDNVATAVVNKEMFVFNPHENTITYSSGTNSVVFSQN